MTGKVKSVLLRGELIVEDDRWHGKAGSGRYIARGESGGW